MKTQNNQIVLTLRILISALFLLSVVAKLYPIPMYGITKIFEQGQLIPMGFSESLAPYFSRFIIGAELFLAITILFNNYLKKIIVPLAFIMVAVFSIHLSTQIFGNSENCGCFGELIPMTPLEALIKNILTLIVLAFIYKKSEDITGRLSNLMILFLLISTLMFAFLPISSQSKSEGNSFISFVDNEDFVNSGERKILCFFDAGCEHCQHAARSLDSLSNLTDDFPQLHIIFSDAEEYNIPSFFEFTGSKYPYQVMPQHNYDTDEIDSYMEITFPDYDNPVVILYDGVRQVRLYEGTGERAFSPQDLKRILESKK
ncbi:MAG: MauE/DoxX family redox-associated membrane protein [Bacteroidota bacterium]|nr:MauE/DoxX family redox-associated membrane protein [Bacteroidota bacterium]